MNLWNVDQEAVLTALSCFGQLCEEAEICCGSDDLTLMQVVPNYNVYADLAAAARIGPQGRCNTGKGLRIRFSLQESNSIKIESVCIEFNGGN